ncbi:EmrB/QacA subfamily drug resistance transporter [Actinomadura coerulea]|uniref:EmrB/QacA subfamily drug resistance transporter n=1 Tax=Actinomadura coerulea TaxID=46159 RepID=A0A7X0KXU4_9ACTN|nr:MFS transporter [Actinomadura coerulea]MBB6394489.1 EmrB/QacA subfamily drug resistance transporter [Actinomadura coerulea]GGQ29119.1 MFS transporter [Actinomadura coerulea]
MPDVRLGTGPGRWILLATVLGSSVAFLDSTVVNVALPRLARDLNADMADLQWTVNAYTLTLAGFILLGGSLGDRFGRRRIFLVGVVWFAVASVLCGAAPNVETLVMARALQGVGGALLTPGSLAIIQASFAADDRPRAVGAWSGLGGVAGAIGPFVGGWLVEAAGWRWVFLLNVPLAAVVVLVAVRHVPESVDPQAHGRFDVSGAALAALALAGTTYALTEAPGGGAPAPVIAAAAIGGLAAAVAFVLLERLRGRPRRRAGREAPQPMLPLDVFSSRQFSAVNVVTFIMYGGMGVMFFLFVLNLQVVTGFSPIAAGTALLPVTVLMLLLSARAGALAQKIGPRLPMTVGLLVAALGMLLVGRIGADASYVRDVLPAVVVFGLGLAAVVAPLTATVLATADVRHAGVASGVNNAVARAAGLLAVAAIPPLAGLTGDAFNNPADFSHGFRLAMITCAALLAAGAVLSFLTVGDDALRTPSGAAVEPECRRQCGVGAPQLQPEPETVPAERAGRAPGESGA